MLETIPTITVRKDGDVAFARFLNMGENFNTHGHLRGRREFQGLGSYTPFDSIELDELMAATYVVYSYDTPIAWRTKLGAWVRNVNAYSATTRNHQRKIFSAIDLL